MKFKGWKIVILCVILMGCFISQGLAQDECTIYREVFPYQYPDSGSTSKEKVFSQGWYGEQHGSHICLSADQDLQILTSTKGAELEAVNSDPQGPGAGSDTGGAYYSPLQRAGIYIFTSEYAFLSSVLSKIRLEARNSACGTAGNQNSCTSGSVPDQVTPSLMRPALRINGVWYISESGQNIQSHKPDPGSWVPYEFDVGGLTFGAASQYSDTPEIVCNGGDSQECSADEFNCLPRKDSTSGLSLPEGVVDAFGIYIEKNYAGEDSRATYRIDNFEIVASVPCRDIAAGTCVIGDGQNAECQNVSMEACIENDGIFNPGARCPEQVPTVGSWGLVALTILLIGSALWSIQRRKKA